LSFSSVAKVGWGWCASRRDVTTERLSPAGAESVVTREIERGRGVRRRTAVRFDFSPDIDSIYRGGVRIDSHQRWGRHIERASQQTAVRWGDTRPPWERAAHTSTEITASARRRCARNAGGKASRRIFQKPYSVERSVVGPNSWNWSRYSRFRDVDGSRALRTLRHRKRPPAGADPKLGFRTELGQAGDPLQRRGCPGVTNLTERTLKRHIPEADANGGKSRKRGSSQPSLRLAPRKRSSPRFVFFLSLFRRRTRQ